MKIVIASDSYKGSSTTLEVAESIEKGIRRVYENAEIIKIPVADGGEGTVDALVLGTNGTYEEVEVTGPLGEKVIAKYGVLNGNSAIIEMAAASGITLIDSEDLNPLITTTYGTGELIKSALERGIKKIYVGLGGSSTNDGGVGMAQALGVSFKDKFGDEIGYGGGELIKIKTIDMANINPLLKNVEIIALSDVMNTLCGRTGAAYIFGPQKGASVSVVEELDENLKYFSEVIERELGKIIIDVPGAGAAGGLGGGLIAFLNATIQPGIERVLDITNIDYSLKGADFIITGEGQIDMQSIYGKVPVGIAKRAKKHKVPVIAIVGSVGEGASEVYSHGIDIITDIINKPMSLEKAIENAPKLIEDAAENVARIIKLNEKLLNTDIKVQGTLLYKKFGGLS